MVSVGNRRACHGQHRRRCEETKRLYNADTDLLHLVSSLWYKQQPSFDKDDTLLLQKLWTVLVEIGTSGMWQGLLPYGMVEYQQEYYHSIGSKKTGKKWAS